MDSAVVEKVTKGRPALPDENVVFGHFTLGVLRCAADVRGIWVKREVVFQGATWQYGNDPQDHNCKAKAA